MRAFEFLFEVIYYPPSSILEYSREMKVMDLLIGLDNEIIDDILNLRKEIINKSNLYVVPPLTALGKKYKKEIREYLDFLKKDISHVSPHANILDILEEMIGYMNSMN